MTLLTDITFFELALAAVALGAVERFVLPHLPARLVGPEGLLLRA